MTDRSLTPWPPAAVPGWKRGSWILAADQLDADAASQLASLVPLAGSPPPPCRASLSPRVGAPPINAGRAPSPYNFSGVTSGGDGLEYPTVGGQ